MKPVLDIMFEISYIGDGLHREGIMERGMGTVYLRGKTWWIQYFQNGYPYRESSGSSKKMAARELLKKRMGEISEGKTPTVRFDKVMLRIWRMIS
jgi:hypothetical protein